jgi:hypothetical protein
MKSENKPTSLLTVYQEFKRYANLQAATALKAMAQCLDHGQVNLYGIQQQEKAQEFCTTVILPYARSIKPKKEIAPQAQKS